MTDPFVAFRDKFREDWHFFKGWVRKPGEVGAVAPTGKHAARAMAAFVPEVSTLPVLELGPGTGSITQALLDRGIAPERIVSVEYSRDFYAYLVENFPGVNFINGDAFRIRELLADTPWNRFCAVIGAVPVLTLPKHKRARLIDDYLSLVADDGPFVQISYGPRAPLPGRPGHYVMESTDWIVKNVPPARLYVYRRDLG